MDSRKRRRLFPVVDRSLQFRFLAMILTYGFAIVVILALFLLVPDLVKLANENLSLQVRAAAADKVLTLHARLWPAVIALICVFGLHGHLILHRLVGPLYRFRLAFSQVRDGDISFRLRLRAKDYLKAEEAGFNEMLAVLAEKCGSIQLETLDALRTLAELESAISDPQHRSLLQAHRKHLESILAAAEYFHLPQPQAPEAAGGEAA